MSALTTPGDERAFRHARGAVGAPADERFAREPAGQPPDCVSASGNLWIAPADRAALAAAGLDTFAALWNASRGTLLRQLPDRENRRLLWPRLDEAGSSEDSIAGSAAAAPQAGYLKKHVARRRRGGARPWLVFRRGPSPARVEAQAIAQLEAAGIPTVRLIAWGEGADAEGWPASLVLVEELAGYTQLDHFLRQRFPARQPGIATRRDLGLQRLRQQVAHLAARLHAVGWCHRDLYCCHFFVRETAPNEFDVRLIDLQRARRLGWWPGRWIVKDLAQLAYSAPRERLTVGDRMAVLRHYLGTRRLGPAGARLARAVVARQRRMERTIGLHP